MNKYIRTGVVIAATAALSTPLAATAETETIKPGRDGTLPGYADITQFRATNGQQRVIGTLRLANLNPKRMKTTRLVVKQRNNRWSWTVVVRRSVQGKVLQTFVNGRTTAHGPGVGLSCPAMNVKRKGKTMRVSTPRRCLPNLKPGKPVRMRANLVSRTGKLSGSDSFVLVKDRTPFSGFLRRG